MWGTWLDSATAKALAERGRNPERPQAVQGKEGMGTLGAKPHPASLLTCPVFSAPKTQLNKSCDSRGPGSSKPQAWLCGSGFRGTKDAGVEGLCFPIH